MNSTRNSPSALQIKGENQGTEIKLFISHYQKGMSLLEVLVSIIILAIGMLGIASMILVSNQANNSSYMKQQAIQSVYNIFDKIRSNTQAAASGNYNVSNIGSTGSPTAVTTPIVQCNAAACTPAQLAAYDTSAILS